MCVQQVIAEKSLHAQTPLDKNAIQVVLFSIKVSLHRCKGNRESYIMFCVDHMKNILDFLDFLDIIRK